MTCRGVCLSIVTEEEKRRQAGNPQITQIAQTQAQKVLEEVAGAGWWMNLKARVGKLFLRLGTFLGKELEDNDQKRVQLAVDSVVTYLKRT